MRDLYRLVYTSRNQMPGSEAAMAEAVAQILETSRRNNVRADVTGALMFNGGAFAQVLEGPRRGVEQTFERIQRDMRHGDVTVLQCGPVDSRGFTNWSMAFVGQSARGLAMWSGLAAESGFDPSRIDGDAVFTMLHGLVLEEEGIAAGVSPAAPAAPVAASPQPKAQPERDVSRAVDEPAPAQGKAAPPKSAAETAFAVLKAALAVERQRTTELRDEIDDLRVMLAQGQGQLDAMRAERDLWAERARLLAKALCREADEAAGIAQGPGEEGARRQAGAGASRRAAA
jgi:blue light- and temperature-responsive anti-repressor